MCICCFSLNLCWTRQLSASLHWKGTLNSLIKHRVSCLHWYSDNELVVCIYLNYLTVKLLHKIYKLQLGINHRYSKQRCTASSPPSYSGQFPDVSLRLSSSVMMMFSMSFIVRWSRKAWNSTCFSSSSDSCCMSNCRGTERSMQRQSSTNCLHEGRDIWKIGMKGKVWKALNILERTERLV